jgi:transcriptional regulator GlxA family with amidase domain
MLRVDEASKLFDTTDRKLTDIALQVGFSDYKFFSSVFKKIKGMRPSEYKRLQKN